MAKAEYDKTPLEVAKVSTERLKEQAPWALAVASTGIQLCLGDNFKKNKPVEFENLQNWMADQLVAAADLQNQELSKMYRENNGKRDRPGCLLNSSQEV